MGDRPKGDGESSTERGIPVRPGVVPQPQSTRKLNATTVGNCEAHPIALPVGNPAKPEFAQRHR